MLTQIYNGKILTENGEFVENGSIVLDGTRIARIIPDSNLIEDCEKHVDAEGCYVLPGGIDIHVHGGGGRDFMEATEDAFKTAVETHRKHGTTAILPTLSSSTKEMIEQAAEVAEKMVADPKSGVLGLHLEGPYFNPVMAGGQIPENIRLADPKEYKDIVERFPCIRRWDAAPELPGSLDFASYLKSKGVIAGLGHTQAGFDDVKKGYDAGFSFATHFYNAMTGAHKNGVFKHEGTIESVYLFDGINVEMIADGIHVPEVVLKMIHKFKGSDRTCLITDALATAAAPKDAKAFDPRVIVENGVAMLSDHSAIAGSVATMDRLIRTAVHAGIPLAEASKMASGTPAKILGVDNKKGSLKPGKDADVIIMDKDLNLKAVYAMGDEVEM